MRSRALAGYVGDTDNVEEQLTESIYIGEAGFVVKNLAGEHEKVQAYRLRHRVYCEELEWVHCSETLLEIDEYDGHAAFIGVFNQDHILVAFTRLILPGSPFMIEKEFSAMIDPWYKIRKQSDTAEASRLCVAREARRVAVRGTFGAYSLSMLVYKGVYHWCSMNNIRYVYIVVEHKLYRMLRVSGFQTQMLGEPVTMPDGCVAVAAVLDWKEFMAVNTSNRPEFAKWFSSYGSAHYATPRLQPEFYSRPQASP